MLFKADERGGDAWAEKVTGQLAGLLGLPHVPYELAREASGRGRMGVVCPSCVPEGGQLVHGNQLLLTQDPGYPADAPRYRCSSHTVTAVATIVAALQPPAGHWMADAPDGMAATEVFAGYLLLDAWTANQDRHHENRASIETGSSRRLAPSFDHGSTLARNLLDPARREHLDTRDRHCTVDAFARRARAALYASSDDRKALDTIAAYRSFLAETAIREDAWLVRLEGVSADLIDDVLRNIPLELMSQDAREFVRSLLAANRRRLLEE